MVLITIVTGAYKPTNITGGPHIVALEIIPQPQWYALFLQRVAFVHGIFWNALDTSPKKWPLFKNVTFHDTSIAGDIALLPWTHKNTWPTRLTQMKDHRASFRPTKTPNLRSKAKESATNPQQCAPQRSKIHHSPTQTKVCTSDGKQMTWTGVKLEDPSNL
jgi:hypothetical protein